MSKRGNKNITTFEEHLDKQYGLIGSLNRTEFEIKAKAFANNELKLSLNLTSDVNRNSIIPKQ